jgi:hypothetical protein
MYKAIASVGILFVAIGLGVSDALFVEGGLPKAVLPDTPYVDNAAQSLGNTQDNPPQTDQPSSDSGTTSSVAVGVRKASGPDVLKTIATFQMEIQESDELTILRTVIPEAVATVHEYVLLIDGDRAGLIAWTDSPKVKQFFLALKEALHASFSPHVRDLLDESQRIPGKPPRNFLTFFDEGLSSERIVFLRVRERLYELRIVEGNDDVMFELVDALTQ